MIPTPIQSLNIQQLPPPEGLLLPFQQGRRWVSLPQIVRLEGISNYTRCLFIDGSELLVALCLKRLATRLPAGTFMRAHRKHLINRDHIEAVCPAQLRVALSNGDAVKVSRRRVNAFVADYRRSKNSRSLRNCGAKA